MSVSVHSQVASIQCTLGFELVVEDDFLKSLSFVGLKKKKSVIRVIGSTEHG